MALLFRAKVQLNLPVWVMMTGTLTLVLNWGVSFLRLTPTTLAA